MTTEFSSFKLLEKPVNEFTKLPGIGSKTALRLVLYLLNQKTEKVEQFGNTFIEMKNNIKLCQICNNISDTEVCRICSDVNRNDELICVTENVKDVLAIENTGQYFGMYHVLGGIISPINGVGPSDLKIDQLERRVEKSNTKEVILALSTTMEGDTTNYYIYRKLSKYKTVVSIIARGVAFGDELEYTDDFTLGRSIKNRISFEQTLQL